MSRHALPAFPMAAVSGFCYSTSHICVPAMVRFRERRSGDCIIFASPSYWLGPSNDM